MILYKNKILAIVGPTASGKSKLSIEIAKIFNGEVVSADSMQVYRGMDISTAKVTKHEMCGIKHHLIDLLDPIEVFNVAKYKELASKCVDDILKRDKLPILCGGTGLYVDSLIYNTEFSETNCDYNLREALLKKGKKLGGESLLNELNTFDPDMARQLHPNNLKRIVRAIEIYRSTGKTMSEHIKDSRNNSDKYNPTIIGLNYINRDILYNRINMRVDQMIAKGIEEETKNLLKNGIGLTALEAIGCKEIIGYISGEYSMETAAELMKRNTRNYAKRQLTWFKRNKNIYWIYVDLYETFDEVLKETVKTIKLQKN